MLPNGGKRKEIVGKRTVKPNIHILYSPVPGYPTNMVGCLWVEASTRESLHGEDKGCCGASNQYSLILNKTVYFVVREELCCKEIVQNSIVAVNSPMSVHFAC